MWSDRIGRRKPFVIWSGLIAAVALVILGFASTWPVTVAGAVILAIGFGTYTAVDFAMITQVLPAALDRAKDLGVINIANALPQVLAPVWRRWCCRPTSATQVSTSSPRSSPSSARCW